LAYIKITRHMEMPRHSEMAMFSYRVTTQSNRKFLEATWRKGAF